MTDPCPYKEWADGPQDTDFICMSENCCLLTDEFGAVDFDYEEYFGHHD